MASQTGLENLPVELVYLVQLLALSPSLPHTSRRLYQIFKSAPTSFSAEYILTRAIATEGAHPGKIAVLTRALRYPLCSTAVLDVLYRKSGWQFRRGDSAPELARRLFRTLAPRTPDWNESDHPLPFLRHLYSMFPDVPDLNSHGGYALTRAVCAGFRPLVRFLLDHGASPNRKNGLAVLMAIRQKDLSLVKMLIERNDDFSAGVGERKRQRLQDRVEVTSEMFAEAVRCDAREIVEYLLNERGSVPDLRTLHLLRGRLY